MTSLILMMVLRADQADAAINRYVNTMRAMPTYEVQVTYSAKGKEPIHADLIMDRRTQLLYHVTTSNDDYKLSVSQLGYREVERYTRTYDEFPYNGSAKLYESRISPYFKTLPSWLNAPSIRNLAPSGMAFAVVRQETVSGHRCDFIRANFSTQFGTGTTECDIADNGLLYRMHRIMVAMGKRTDETWEFANYVKASSFSLARFANPVPDGFSPYALNSVEGPAMIGTKPSLDGFANPSSGSRWSVPTTRPLLLLIAGHDSLPSEKAVRQFASWKNQLQSAGASLAVVSDATSAEMAKGLPYSLDQKAIEQLAPPATPMLYLLNKSGKITNLWMGFDSSDAAKLRADVLQAIESMKN